MSDDIAELVASNRELVASNRELAEAIRMQTMALHALADAIAAPLEDEPEAEPAGDGVERYLDGTPVGD